MKDFLLLGSNSKLANCIRLLYPTIGTFLSKDDCDITSFESVKKVGNKVTGATFHNKDLKKFLTVKANVVIEATELGELFAAAGAGPDRWP